MARFRSFFFSRRPPVIIMTLMMTMMVMTGRTRALQWSTSTVRSMTTRSMSLVVPRTSASTSRCSVSRIRSIRSSSSGNSLPFSSIGSNIDRVRDGDSGDSDSGSNSNSNSNSNSHTISEVEKRDIQSVIICGPSGVGKGTLIERLLHDFPERYALSVSHTSRSPRRGEIDGVHYHFINKNFMLQDIKHGRWKYLEHAEVHGNWYGTREDGIAGIHGKGKICVLDLDTCGVQQLTENNFPAWKLFIAPPSMKELEVRLRGRGTEKEDQIITRVHNAEKEVEYGLNPQNFDAVIVNDDLDRSFEKLKLQLQLWFPDSLSVREANKT